MDSELLESHINDFENVEEVLEMGKTNYSTLYEALSKKLNKQVYLKVIEKKKLKEGKTNLLLRQIENQRKVLSECKSENIMEMYDFFETEQNYIFVLEYCETNLPNYILENCTLETEPQNFLEIVKGIANALKILYSKKIIHRDIKPENIFLNIINEKPFPKLSGFDSSTFLNDNNFEQMGTLLYMAPEMIENEEYNEKCDLWSLGITLHEAFFGITPYGLNISFSKISDLINEDNFPLMISDFPNLNIFFRKLLTVDPSKRMNFQEFFEYVESKDFMDKNIIYIDGKENLYKNVYIECMDKKNQIDPNEEDKEAEMIKNESSENLQMEEVKTLKEIVKGNVFPDLMSFSDDCEKLIYNNIIYYDENVEFFKKNIYKDSDLFEQNTNGAFLLCTDFDSLKLIMSEIKAENRDDVVLFNLITTGRHCKKVIEYLKENDYIKYIQNACVFCMKVKDHEHFIKDYKGIIEGVYKSRDKVLDFIKNTSSEKIKPFPAVKLVTFKEYKLKYFKRHIELAKNYGVLDENNFKIAYTKLKSFIEKCDKKNLYKSKDILAEGFKKFGKHNDIKTLNEIIINEYTKETFYGDLNRWLMSLNKDYYDIISYFTARLMYSLNSYAKDKNKYYWTKEKNLLYRGSKISYSSLLSYERAKGEIILLSAFTSTSEKDATAYKFSGRKKSKKNYEKSKKFSVIYNIKNEGDKNWVSNGVDIQDIAKYKKEKEVLFQPFSFFILEDVKIDKQNYTVDITLRSVGKCEILENKIKNLLSGNEITYNSDLNIITIKN